MPPTVDRIEISTATGITLAHKLVIPQARKNRLMVLLPGRSYTVQAPLMYYLSEIGQANGYDVLLVQYAFQVTQQPFSPEIFAESEAAVHKAAERGYDEICIVGKSLGSPLAVQIATTLNVPKISLILLTPVQNCAQLVKGIRTLAIIGTADPGYPETEVDGPPGVEWQVLDGLDHGLEAEGDWRRSLDALGEVMGMCERFVREGNKSEG